MSDRTCNVEDCERPHRARGLCTTHYKRWVNGDLRADVPVRTSESIGYTGAHERVNRTFGKAYEHCCVRCDGQAEEWSYDYLDQDDKIDVRRGIRYSLKPEHYMPLCTACHRWCDLGVKVRESGTLLKRRYRRHKRGDHSLCRPERECEPIA
jgi:hypothetical protein